MWKAIYANLNACQGRRDKKAETVGESQAAHKGMFGNRGALCQGFRHAYQYMEQGESWSELSKLFSLSRDQGRGEQPVWQSGKLPTAQHPSTSGNTKGLHFPPSLGTLIKRNSCCPFPTRLYHGDSLLPRACYETSTSFLKMCSGNYLRFEKHGLQTASYTNHLQISTPTSACGLERFMTPAILRCFSNPMKT